MIDLTTVTTATDDRLAALADVKDALDITDGKFDQTLERMIRRASRRIESHLQRPLLMQTYHVVMPGYGRDALRLPHYPVRGVLGVFDGTDTGSAAELLATEYRLDKEAGLLSRDEGFDWTFDTNSDVIIWPEPGQETPRWLVRFSAGYVGPSGTSNTGNGASSTGVTLPQDIQDACISLVRTMFFNRKQADNVTSKRVGEISISYGQQTGGLPDDVLAALSPYRSNV